MIGQLNGEIIEITPTELIVDCGGVGYEVKISLNTYSTLPKTSKIRIFTKFIVREDAQILYGFAEKIDVDLWQYQSPSGASLGKAFAYLKPYLKKEKAWPFQQIIPFDEKEAAILFQNAQRLP